MRLEPGPLYRYRKHSDSISHVLKREHIEAMLAADADFAARYPDQPTPVRRAQAARRRSLEAALTYDGVIAQLKAHDVTGGLKASLHDPAVWPLLTMPVKARLKRFTARLNQPHDVMGATA
jgi:succinoglycan biosynthesis protein ExoO